MNKLEKCIAKDDFKFFPQIFLEEALYNELAQDKAFEK